MIIVSNKSLVGWQISKCFRYFRVHVLAKCFDICCESCLHICCHFLNMLLDFTVELLFLTKCDRLVLSSESTVKSPILY
jgi:hypothetical protein